MRMNRPCKAVHVIVTRREGITQQVAVLMRRMWWIMVVHVEKPS